MLIIFDWDGTLVDSAGQIVDTMQRAAEQCGLPPRTEDEIRHIIGLGLPEAIRHLYPEATPASVDALRDRYSECYRAGRHGLAPYFPNVMETLRALAASGYTLAVATGKSRRGLARELAARELDGLFCYTRCADETASKPDPRMLLEIMAEHGGPAHRAVMVGDTVFDMDMADRAGIRKLAVSYGAHPVHSLQATAPDLLVDDFSTILGWINQIES